MSNYRCEVSLFTTKEKEVNTPLQNQRRSSVRISHLDSHTIRRDHHPWSLYCSIRTPDPADTARSLQVSHALELLATRVPSDQRALMQRCDHGATSDQ